MAFLLSTTHITLFIGIQDVNVARHPLFRNAMSVLLRTQSLKKDIAFLLSITLFNLFNIAECERRGVSFVKKYHVWVIA